VNQVVEQIIVVTAGLSCDRGDQIVVVLPAHVIPWSVWLGLRRAGVDLLAQLVDAPVIQ
jgi:hypothetical protein